MISFVKNHYRSKKQQLGFLTRLFPSTLFYFRLFFIVFRASRTSQKGNYGYGEWMSSSYKVLQELEAIGVTFDISGVENLQKVEGPVVFIGNHMSMMETLVLPVIIQPYKNLTFVIKESLLHYPIFKHIMQSRDPVAVTRTNPREDLKRVMNGGIARLKDNICVVVFPQTTRAQSFDPKQMSSIGVKLAKKAKVAIVPIALKTDCWENGNILKDFGRINTQKIAYFKFGEPLQVEGKGEAEQTQINDFISEQLATWSK